MSLSRTDHERIDESAAARDQAQSGNESQEVLDINGERDVVYRNATSSALIDASKAMDGEAWTIDMDPGEPFCGVRRARDRFTDFRKTDDDQSESKNRAGFPCD